MGGGDSRGDGAEDGGFRDFGGDEVGVAGVGFGEEGEDCDEQGGGGVGVEAVVRFDYYVAFFLRGGVLSGFVVGMRLEVGRAGKSEVRVVARRVG